jgi:cobalamin-dependent methionine synthase I
MIIIGEKINATRKAVGQALAERNKTVIQDLACRQSEAGAAWLDVNAGSRPDVEAEGLNWLVETVQEVTETPLCLDSANPQVIAAAIGRVHKTPLINSISYEKDRFTSILPLVKQYQCPVIVLAMDDKGIPKTSQGRVEIIRKIIEETRQNNLADDLLYIDPMVMSLSIDTEAGNNALKTMQMIHREFPSVHLVSGLSNISFGLPGRSLINRAFITLAVESGLDSAILDPLDKGLISSLLAAELVLGKDRFCRNYNKAFRAGILEIQK